MEFKKQLQMECDLLQLVVAERDLDKVSKICHSLITTVTTINKTSAFKPIIEEISWNGSELEDWEIAEFHLASLCSLVPKAIEDASAFQAELVEADKLPG